MRAKALSLLPVVLAASVAACEATPPARQADYAIIRGVVVDEYWRYLMEDASRQVFIQPIPIEEPGRKAAYLRFEERANRGNAVEPMLSARSVFEFDCAKGRFRTVNTTFYARQNLKQSYAPIETPPGPWVRPDPNSIASRAYESSCQTRLAQDDRAGTKTK